MNRYNPNIHHRRSIRLKGYDYAQAGLYFITICVQHRLHLFGEVKAGEMQLNSLGHIANQEWLNTSNIRKNIALHEHIIMPNHIHGIIEILFKNGDKNIPGTFQSPSQTIGSIIRGYKIATIKQIKNLILHSKDREEISISTGELQFTPTIAPTIIKLDFKIWQRNYYENIIRNERAYQNISNYILNNPKKWEADKFNKNK